MYDNDKMTECNNNVKKRWMFTVTKYVMAEQWQNITYDIICTNMINNAVKLSIVKGWYNTT